MRPWCSFAAALALVACAARPAEPPRAAEAEAAPTAQEPAAEGASTTPAGLPAAAAAPVAADDDRPAGELVCRGVSEEGGATELFLDWKGGEADGTLREVAPSGMVHEKKVHAERQQGLVVADDIYEKDLVTHAAIVAERGGKKLMKVDNAWVRCQ